MIVARLVQKPDSAMNEIAVVDEFDRDHDPSLAANQRRKDSCPSPLGRPRTRSSTAMSSSSAGQWIPMPRPIQRQLARSAGEPWKRRGNQANGIVLDGRAVEVGRDGREQAIHEDCIAQDWQFASGGQVSTTRPPPQPLSPPPSSQTPAGVQTCQVSEDLSGLAVAMSGVETCQASQTPAGVQTCQV